MLLISGRKLKRKRQKRKQWANPRHVDILLLLYDVLPVRFLFLPKNIDDPGPPEPDVGVISLAEQEPVVVVGWDFRDLAANTKGRRENKNKRMKESK